MICCAFTGLASAKITAISSSAHCASSNHCPHSLQSNRFDLNRYALGQLVDSDARPGRLVREPLLILAVHLREVGHVCDEDLGRFGQHKVDKRNWRALEWHRESHGRIRRSAANLYSDFLGNKHEQICMEGKIETLTPTLTTLSILLPAASRIAFKLRQHAAVFSAIEPSTRLPSVSAGIWPAHQIWPLALIAWLYGPAARWRKES